MVPHDKENPIFTYTFAVKRQAILSTKIFRGVPQKAADKLAFRSSLCHRKNSYSCIIEISTFELY
jgi:hypothetical protein